MEVTIFYTYNSTAFPYGANHRDIKGDLAYACSESSFEEAKQRLITILEKKYVSPPIPEPEIIEIEIMKEDVE